MNSRPVPAPAYATPAYQGRNVQSYPGTSTPSKGYSGTAIAGAAVAGVVAGAVINEALDSDVPAQAAQAAQAQVPQQAQVYQPNVVQQPAQVYQPNAVQQAPAPQVVVVAPQAPQVAQAQQPVKQEESGIGFGTILLIGLLGVGGYAAYRVLSNKPAVRSAVPTHAPLNTSSLPPVAASVIADNVSAAQRTLVEQLKRNAETEFRAIKNAYASGNTDRLMQSLSESLQASMGDDLKNLEPTPGFSIRSLNAPQMIEASVNHAGDLVVAIRYTWVEADNEHTAPNDAVWFFLYNNILNQWQLHGWEEV